MLHRVRNRVADHVVGGRRHVVGQRVGEHATTVSVNALEIRDWQTRDGFAALTAGAVLGGLTPEPTLPVAR